MGDVFIVGAPRSGTSWLRTLLASHPDLASPFELHLFSRYLAPLDDAFSAEEHARVRRLAAGMNEATGLASLLARGEFDDWLADLHRRARATALTGKPGATRLLEKTPGHAMHLDLIRRLAPGARFLHLVRDPRDVVASMLARSERPYGEWAPADVDRATSSWKKHVGAARRNGRSEDTRLVRYEDLVEDVEAELGRIADWLGLAGPIASWLSGDPRAQAHERADALTVRREFDAGAGSETSIRAVIGRPNEGGLSPAACYFVESRCAAEMAELAYAPRAHRPAWKRPLLALAAGTTANWGRIRSRLARRRRTQSRSA